MSSNTIESETHKIEANDDLIRSVIVDQTDNLEKGWREAFQNGIDSDATEVRLNFDAEYTLIADNGSGVELNEQKGLDLLTVMGESSKDKNDHDSIGEFGIGKGQIIAKGQTIFVSGTTALLFDIKNWGLEAKTVPLSRVDDFVRELDGEWADLVEEKFGHISNYCGMAILVNHYPDEVPEKESYKWTTFEENIEKRFQYLNSVRYTKLYVNDDLISDKNPLALRTYGKKSHTETYTGPQGGDVQIAVKHGHGSLTVYSGGIKVCNVDSRGISGRIVTENNLRLNFARNEIKSGCPIWNDIEGHLNEVRANIYQNCDKDLNDSARKFIADRLFNHNEFDKYSDIEVFETASESLVSWEEITSEQEIGLAKKNNPAADKLEEAYGAVVLNEEDGAVERFQEARDDLDEAPPDFDAESRAEQNGLHTSYENLEEESLTPTQQKKLGIARRFVDIVGDNREVRYGESDVAAAWTDGESFITITDSAGPSSTWMQWVPELWETVMHELAHEQPSKEEPSHGITFNRIFRKTIEKKGGAEALSQVMGEIREENLTTIAQRGHSDE